MFTDRIALFGAGGALIVVTGLAASLAWGQHNAIADRDKAVDARNQAQAETVVTTDFADRLCSVFGATYSPVKGDKPRPRKEWGETCLGIAKELWRREQGKAVVTLNTVTAHNAQQTKKRAADAVAARRDTMRNTTAQQELETAHAGVQDGHYDLAPLNRAFGLRAPQQPDPVEPAAGDARGAGPD